MAIKTRPIASVACTGSRRSPGRRALLSPQGVEMKKGRRQTNGQVGGSHLVLGHAGRHVAQQTEQRAQGLTVLVGQQQYGGPHRLQTELFRYVWGGREGMKRLMLNIKCRGKKRLITAVMLHYVNCQLTCVCVRASLYLPGMSYDGICLG